MTFLFADVQGSTELLQRLGDEYAEELYAHRTIVREAIEASSGEIVDQRGEDLFAAFPRAANAVAAAVAIQRAHEGRIMQVRIGLHTGEPSLTGDSYLGLDVHRAARICAAGHGGQILLSSVTRALITGQSAVDLGEYMLRGLSTPERIHQLHESGLAVAFPPLRAPPVATRRTTAAFVRRWRKKPRTTEQLGWDLRAQLPLTPADARPALSKLATSLVAAGRATIAARRFLAQIDRRRLERQLLAYRSFSLTSARASTAAEHIEQRLALLDAVARHVSRVEEAARGEAPSAKVVEEATNQLETELGRARVALGPHTQRLRRTLHRGVYRAGDEFVVLVVDENGIEKMEGFESRGAARAFLRATRLADHRRRPTHVNWTRSEILDELTGRTAGRIERRRVRRGS